MRRTQRLLFCLFWTLLPCLAGAEVTMEARLGLQETVRLEKWNQIIVRLQNSGQPMAGTLGVRVWRGSDMRGDLHVTSFTQPVSLSERARKRYQFTVPVTSITRPIEVFLRRGEAVLKRQNMDLRTALSAEQIVLGLTRDLSLDFLTTLLPTHTRIVYLPQDELPQHWYGYDSVSAVVLKGLSLQTCQASRGPQEWVCRRRPLIVASDSVRPAYERGLQALLQCGARRTANARACGIGGTYGVRCIGAAARYAARLTQGEVLVAAPMRRCWRKCLRQWPRGLSGVDYAPGLWPAGAATRPCGRHAPAPERIDFSRGSLRLGLLDERPPGGGNSSRLFALPFARRAWDFLIAFCGR